MSEGRTAIVFGVSGSVGKSLLFQLATDPDYTSVVVFTKKMLPSGNSKIAIHVVDFENLQSYMHLIKGNDLFCSYGKEKVFFESLERKENISVKTLIKLANIAKNNQVEGFFCMVPKNTFNRLFFFLRKVTVLEKAISVMRFERYAFLKPTFIIRGSSSYIQAEPFSLQLKKFIGSVPVGKLRNIFPIDIDIIAKAMVKIAKTKMGKKFYNSYELKNISDDHEV